LTIRKTIVATIARLLHTDLPDPIESVQALPDGQGHVYVWIARPDATDDQIAALSEDLGRAVGSRQALHLVVRDIAEVRHLSPAEVREHLLPVVRAAEEAGWQ
jgi:hypothetical protein